MSMHVLVVPSESVAAAWSPLGGVFQVDLARAMRSVGVQVGILSVGKVPVSHLLKSTGVPRFEEHEGIAIHRRYLRLPLPQSADRGMRLGHVYAWVARRAFAAYVERHGRPDVLHAHNVRYGGVIASALSRAFGIPYFITEHSSEYASGRVVGDGPLRETLHSLAAALGIAPRVEFLGRLPRAGVGEALRTADAFVLSSRAETFGVVLVEALVSGVPVISTACGGPQDIVEPGMGLLVPPGDVGAMADAMQRLRHTAHQFDASSLAAAVRSRFAPTVVAGRYVRWFHDHSSAVPTRSGPG